MALTTLPVIGYGAADVISGSGYTTTGTLAAITTATDPFGGSSAYTLNDTDGAAVSARNKVITGLAGTTDLLICAKAGTSSASTIAIRDETAVAYRLRLDITWSGGVPSVSASSGTALTAVLLGNGWYAFRGIASALTSGNSHALRLFPTNFTGSSTGSTLFYVRSMVLTDYWGEDTVTYDLPREGSDQDRGAAGIEDAWDGGDDYYLAGSLRSIPVTGPRDAPASVSGWDGANESAGINCGISSFLRAGRKKQTVTFAPDRASASANVVSGYLADPMEPIPTRMPDLTDLTIGVRLRASSRYTIT